MTTGDTPESDGLSFSPPRAARRNAAICAGILIMIEIVVTVFTILYTSSSTSIFSDMPPTYTTNEIVSLAYATLAFAGLLALALITLLAYYLRKRPHLPESRRGRLPLYVLLTTSVGVLMSLFSAAIQWLAFLAKTIPRDVWSAPSFYIPFIFLPVQLEVLTVLPLDLLLLRLVFVYYRRPRLYRWPATKEQWRQLPLSRRLFSLRTSASFWFCLFLLATPVLIAMLISLYFIFFDGGIPKVLGFVPTTRYRFFVLDCYTIFDIWCTFCIFQVRRQLRVHDLDNSYLLMGLSLLASAHTIVARCVAVTVASKYLISFVLLSVLRIVYMLVLLTFYWRQIRSMQHTIGRVQGDRGQAGTGGSGESNVENENRRLKPEGDNSVDRPAEILSPLPEKGGGKMKETIVMGAPEISGVYVLEEGDGSKDVKVGYGGVLGGAGGTSSTAC